MTRFVRSVRDPRSPAARGANFALGTHGSSRTGVLVKLGEGIPQQSREVARFKIITTGSLLTFSIPRQALGN